MQANSAVQKSITFVKGLWPKKIIYKLAVSNVLVLTIVVGGYALYVVTENIKKELDFKTKQYNNYIKQIAAIYINDSETMSKIKLREKIKTLVPVIGDHVVSIKDAKFRAVLALRYENNVITSGYTGTVNKFPPVSKQKYIFSENNILEMWQPLHAGAFNGWVYLRISDRTVEYFSMAFLKQSISIIILSVFISLVWLKKIMVEPLRSLSRASEFAEWLDMAQGNHLQISTNSTEIEHLVHSLNRTSEKLFHNEQTIKSNHLLVDTVRDIQTQYIENKNTTELYASILTKLVQLSESEYGFIGEVLENDKGQQYVKTHAFSNANQNLEMQRFFEKNAPPNMEFHNLHNLFGAVLQTKKPTVANDAGRDPRSGGLPPGHPPIYSFLGLPVFNREELVGVIGVANRRKPYDQDLVAYFQPLLNTIGHIIAANKRNLTHQRAQQQLEQKEALFRTILSTVSDSVITINAGGFIDTINPATENLFGYFREELINLSINQLLPDLFGPEFRKQFVSARKLAMWEREAKRKDGDMLPVEFSVSEFKMGEEQLFTVTIRDVTQRKQVESTYRRTETSLMQAQEIARLGSWELNLETNIITATKEVYSILSITTYGNTNHGNDIALDDLLQKLHKPDSALLRSAIKLGMASGKPFTKEVRIREGSNDFKYVLVHGNLSKTNDTDQKIMVGTVQDVTATQQLIKRKDEFISSVSEEIRSPLTSIRGSIGLLAGEVTHHISDKERVLLDNAYKNTDRLLLLINDILEIENIESGKTEFDFELLEFSHLLEQVLYARERDQERYKITYKLLSIAPDVVLIGDKYRLTQALNILMSNAAKHSPLGGVVEISASVVNNMLIISVKDAGDGVPEAIQAEIFDVYARTKHFHTVSGDSTGFGLCIAKSIIETHSGTIAFESVVGGGATFYVNLPVPQQNITILNS